MPTNNAIVGEINNMIKYNEEMIVLWEQRMKEQPSQSYNFSGLAAMNDYAIQQLRKLKEFIQGKEEKNDKV